MRFSRASMSKGRILGSNKPNDCLLQNELQSKVAKAQKYIDSACGRKFCNQACETNKEEGTCLFNNKVTEYVQEAKETPEACQRQFCQQVCHA